jgi:photosystem II stability/assembly factor-like uncharacterized protein
MPVPLRFILDTHPEPFEIMRIQSTMLLLAVALIPVAAAFQARPHVEAPPAPPLPVSWGPVQYNQPAAPVNSIVTGGRNDRFGISTSHYVVRSTDGGTKWTDVRMPTRFLAADIAFASAMDGYVVGGIGQLLRTQDGGTSWTYTMLPTRALLNAVAVVDPSTLIVVGSDGAILRSSDGGAKWHAIAAETTQHLRDVAFADATRGIAVGMWGTVLVTADGGRSWTAENAGTEAHLTHVEFDAGGNAVATNADATVAVRRTSHAN